MNIFEEYIKANILDIELFRNRRDYSHSPRAANTHNVPVSNIVKSLLVKVGDRFVLYLVPGDKKLDLGAIGEEWQMQRG
jgi:prolyl-tRNA editing enzyme YbaK/EbsC (Cys-tRNA(Pro) deacylase)